MKLLTITIEIDDTSLMSCMTINNEAFEKYKDDYGLGSPEKLAQQAEPVLNAASALTSELASKHMYICKSKGKEIEVIELHAKEIDALMNLLNKKMNE